MLGASAWAQSAPTPVVEWHSFSEADRLNKRAGSDGLTYTLDLGDAEHTINNDGSITLGRGGG